MVFTRADRRRSLSQRDEESKKKVMEQSADLLNGSRPHSSQVNEARLVELGRELLLALGEDPEREGLREIGRAHV